MGIDYEFVILESLETAKLPDFFSRSTIAPSWAFKRMIDANLLEGVAVPLATPNTFKIHISAITPLGFIRLRELRAQRTQRTPLAKAKRIGRGLWVVVLGIIAVLAAFWAWLDHWPKLQALLRDASNPTGSPHQLTATPPRSSAASALPTSPHASAQTQPTSTPTPK